MNGVPWWFVHGFGGALAGTRLRSVDPDGALAIPAPHLIDCVGHASCSVDEPGLVRHHFGYKIILGEPSGETGARLRQLAALCEKAGFEAPPLATFDIKMDVRRRYTWPARLD